MLEWLLCSDPLAALLELFFQPPDGIAGTALGPLHPVKLLNRGLGNDGNETPRCHDVFEEVTILGQCQVVHDDVRSVAGKTLETVGRSTL